MKILRRAGLLLAACAMMLEGSAQLNLTVAGQVDYQNLYNSDISDVWGWVDANGNEYAILGVNDGHVSIVDVTVPASAAEVFSTVVNPSIWYDIKTWNNHAYITTEGGGGLTIIDMSGLPGNTNLPVTTYDYSNDPNAVHSAHNLYIDENGICYIFGADRGNGGTIFLDLSNPTAPVEIGEFDTWYAHDGVVRGDTLYGSHINNGWFSIVDISDKSNPVVLGIQNTPVDFAHNAWQSDDNNYLFTTDEISGAYIASYDVSDPTDIKELDRIRSSPGSGVIPHNTHWIDNYIVTSYYRDGITIHDVSNPANMIEVGNYDSSPLSGDGFNGMWGAYPWLPSGNILGTDIEGGLFIFAPTYVRGCYLEGNVTDAVTLADLNDVYVELLTAGVNENTDINGDYATGTAIPGTYDVAFSKPGYQPDTAYNVTLTNGQLTIVDMTLDPLPSFTLTGTISTVGSGTGVPNAMVNISNNDFNFDITTDGSGNFTLTGFFEGTYDINAGAWGWGTVCLEDVVIDSANSTIDIQLSQGYYDDFTFDFGWTVSGAAPDGVWVREEPNQVTFGGGGLETQPDFDIQGDCLDRCYVTGNGTGFGAGSDDVDDADAVLTSPIIDISTYSNPQLRYYRWFFNEGGQGSPNDSLIISVTDGSSTAVVDMVIGGQANSTGGWNQVSYNLAGLVPGNLIQVIFHTADWDANGGNLVEAAVDVFEVYEATTIPEVSFDSNSLQAFPNPFEESFSVNYQLISDQAAQIELYDISGRHIQSETISGVAGQVTLTPTVESGLYVARLVQGGQVLSQVKLIKR